MKARVLGANLVDLALAAAIAAFPAHLLALGWGARPVTMTSLPHGPVDGPSLATRLLVFLGMLGTVFVLLRWRLERDGQGPGKCLFGLRMERWQVVEDADRLDLVERIGVCASRFARPLLVALASLLLLGLWGRSVERSAIEARQRQILKLASIYDAEYNCCFETRVTQRCEGILEVVAKVADDTDGKGDVPPREDILGRCPGARGYTRR
ncbi:MAG TPA: hypothetical protein VFN45_12435 [Myxococcaceae bacterium]|nr:hypothetical protein [Myxococcaceae bacterium]